MNVNIGKEVQKRAKQLGIGPTELGSLINTSRQNIVGIYKRTSIDSQRLWELSVALSFNFFSLYDMKAIGHEPEATALKELEKLRKEHQQLQREFALLKENNELLKQVKGWK